MWSDPPKLVTGSCEQPKVALYKSTNYTLFSAEPSLQQPLPFLASSHCVAQADEFIAVLLYLLLKARIIYHKTF